MARGVRRSARKKPARSVRIPKGKSARAIRIRRERRHITANPNYLYWIAGWQSREAARTGVVPRPTQVVRDPQFQAHVNTVLGHNPRVKAGPTSRLARALVALGIRDPNFRGAVGNSPGRGVTRAARGPRDRYGNRRGALHP